MDLQRYIVRNNQRRKLRVLNMDVQDKSQQPNDSMVDESQNDNDKDTKKTKKKKSSEKDTLKEKLEELESENKDLQERLLRKAAEFDNYKKRTENEFAQVMANANAGLIADLLPVLDDFERFLGSGHESEDINGLVSGVELIYKNLVKVLEKRGVEPIDAVGQEFDPEKHEALMQVESEEHPSNTVVDEHLKGYVMNDRVLRHSQVLVSK